MTDSSRDRDLDPDRIARALEAAARDDGPTAERLAELLNAAATPDNDRALAGEDAMMAEYRAAAPQPARPARTRRTGPVAFGATVAALSLYGIAAATQNPHTSNAGRTSAIRGLCRPHEPGTARPPRRHDVSDATDQAVHRIFPVHRRVRASGDQQQPAVTLDTPRTQRPGTQDHQEPPKTPKEPRNKGTPG